MVSIATILLSFDTVKTTLYSTEWYRVLRPGGLLLISVPDLKILARLIFIIPLTYCDSQ